MREIGLLTVLIAVLSGLVWLFLREAPAEHNPFAPLHVADPIGMATGLKVHRLRSRPEACLGVLDAAGIGYTPLPDGEAGDPCGFRSVATLDRSAFPYSAPLQMTCALTAGPAVWERQSLIPRAEAILGVGIARVETYGSFSCRRMYGSPSGRWSEHARAAALDISGFRLADGRLVTVKRRWGEDSAEGRFLRAVRNDACRIFSIVLGPEYNSAHEDHFHLDLSGPPGGVCR